MLGFEGEVWMAATGRLANVVATDIDMRFASTRPTIAQHPGLCVAASRAAGAAGAAP